MATSNRLSTRLKNVQSSQTAAVFERVAELRSGGADLISFAVGEPDFQTPQHIRDAAKQAIDDGASRYTAVAGLQVLRQAIVTDSERRRGPTGHGPSQVVVSAGAKHALFNLSQALFEPGDEVIIPTPAWGTYAEQVSLAGATPVQVECTASEGFCLQPEALQLALGRKTRALILCSPSNPTGACYSEAQLRALAKTLAQTDVYIIVDEIYSRLAYDGLRVPSMLSVAPELRDRTIVVDGVSKTFAMTGWRVGWCLAPQDVADACRTVQSQATTSINAPAQHAALAALDGDQGAVEVMRAAYEERRDRMVQGINRIGGLQCACPQGAFYVFVDVDGLLGRLAGDSPLDDDTAVARWLLEDALVAVVPGVAFGAPGYVRLSYAASLADIDRGLQRIQSAVAALG